MTLANRSAFSHTSQYWEQDDYEHLRGETSICFGVFFHCFPTASEWMRGLYAHVCRGHRAASRTARLRSSAAAPGMSCSLAGLGSRWWEGKRHCDLPRSLPSAGTVMLQGNCWPSMSVSGPLPRSVSQPRRRPYLEQLGWAGPAGRRAGEESGHDGETSPPGLARDACRCRVESCGATG